MLRSRIFLIRCATRVLAAVSLILMAVLAMLLGWVITAHASPDPGAGQGRVDQALAARESRIALICPRAPPAMVTKRAILSDVPNKRRPGRLQRTTR
jgi:hypothetical protein